MDLIKSGRENDMKMEFNGGKNSIKTLGLLVGYRSTELNILNWKKRPPFKTITS